MIIIGAVPWIVALASAVIYLVIDKPKPSQLALYAFAVSLLVALFGVSGHVVRIG